MDNVHVVIRVRPLINTEQSSNGIVHWKVQENTIGQLDADSQKKAYTFDRVFSPSSSSVEIFDEVAQPILDAVMEGYNGTIFAYGQTSSGKTHTMIGTDADLGVIPRMAKALFEAIEKMPLRRFLLRLSYMEIYNEKIFDLLRFDKKQLNVREDGNGKTFVENLYEEFVGNCKDLLEIMKKGELNRSYGSTHANEKSSRSHTIFTLTVESAANQEDGEDAVMVSQLNLVDLAGSERASQSRPSGERFREGCAINTSLFTLRKVIKSLSQADGQFICFRDSKLTRILQSSLGGNAKTSIICTVTPAMIDETHSTLQFASTAKTIRNQPTLNEVLSDEALLKRYTKEIQLLQKKLEMQIETEKSQELKEMELKLQETSEKNQLLEQQLLKLRERIVTSSLNPTPRDKIAKVNQNYRRLTWGGPRLCMMPPQRIPSDSTAAPTSVLKSGQESSNDYKTINEEEVFIPGKKVRFERRFSDECLVITNDAECQTNILGLTAQNSAESEALKSRVESLTAENSVLSKKMLTLNVNLCSERANRILAEKRQETDNTFQFLQLENSVQDEEIKNLKEQMANLKKSFMESEALLKDVNHKQAQENMEIRNNLDQLKRKLQDSSNLFQAEHHQLDLAQKKIEKLSVELKDAEIQYEHNQKHADVVKNELRQQLQLAYDRIDYLDHHNACLDVSKIEVHPMEKSIQELTLGAKDFSKLFETLPKSPSKQGTRGIDYDSEMQIVQMEFELREVSHLENIAAKDSRIEELANQLGEATRQHAELLKEMECLKESITNAQEKEEILTAELEKARLNCQAQVPELDMKNWEATQCEMLKKIASLEEEISNYKSMSSISQHSHAFMHNYATPATPDDYPDMHEKIDALLRIVEDFCQKEKSFVAEHPFSKDLNFRKHLKESQDHQEELQRKIEDLRRMVLHFRQKEQHVLGELEGLKAELQNRQSLGNESARTQKDAEETMVLQSDKIVEMGKVIQEMKQKENNLAEKLENLEEHIRQEGANSAKDVEGELIEMRKKAERLEADIVEYKQREEALSRKDNCFMQAMQHHRDACTETDPVNDASWMTKTSTPLPPVPEATEAQKHAETKNKLDQLQAKLAESEILMNNNEEREASLVQEIEKLKEELHRESEDSSRMLRDKMEEFERLKAEHHNKLQQYERMKEEHCNKLKEFDTYKAEHRNKMTEIEKFKLEQCKKLEEAEKLKADHRDKLLESNAEIQDLKLQLTTYQNTSTEAEAKRAETEMKLREYESKVLEGKQAEDQLSVEVKNLQEDLQHHCDRVAEETSILMQTKQKLSELEQKNVEMAKTIEKYARSKDAYLEELGILRLEQELHRNCENTIKELQIEAARCVQREKQLRQYTQTLESDAKSISDSKFNYRELLDELNGIREREIRLRDAVKEREAKMRDAQQQVCRCEETIDSLQQQVYELKNNNDVLQTYLLEMEEREANVESERKLTAKLQSEFEQKELNLRRAVKTAEMRASDLQTECENAKKQCQVLHHKQTRGDCSSVEVQCQLLRNPAAVKTAWTQVQRSLLGEEGSKLETRTNDVAPGTETLLPPMISKTTQCNLIENSTFLKDGVQGKQTSWAFTFTRGIQCELLTEGSISQHYVEESSNPVNETTSSTTLETRVKVHTPQISEEEYVQLKAELESYKMENTNLVSDIREVRGTLHEHSENRRMMQTKLSSLEENLEYMTGKCDHLKAEIRRQNSMKNMSIVGYPAARKQSKSDASGDSPQLLHSGSSLIMRDNMEELQTRHNQLQIKYEKLKKLFMKQTRTKKAIEERMQTATNSSPPARVSKISSDHAPQLDVIENEPPEKKNPLSAQLENVVLPFSGENKQETMKCSKDPFPNAMTAAEIRHFLRRDLNDAHSSPQMYKEEDNCKVN